MGQVSFPIWQNIHLHFRLDINLNLEVFKWLTLLSSFLRDCQTFPIVPLSREISFSTSEDPNARSCSRPHLCISQRKCRRELSGFHLHSSLSIHPTKWFQIICSIPITIITLTWLTLVRIILNNDYSFSQHINWKCNTQTSLKSTSAFVLLIFILISSIWLWLMMASRFTRRWVKCFLLRSEVFIMSSPSHPYLVWSTFTDDRLNFIFIKILRTRMLKKLFLKLLLNGHNTT